MFPEGREYEHDKMDRRTELSEDQKPIEPQNADSHLAFMAGALRTCVTYQNKPGAPVSFIDLDGVHKGRPGAGSPRSLATRSRKPVAQTAAGRARLRPRGGLGQPEEPEVRDLRAVLRAREAARRHQGPAAHHARARRAACRAHRERVRNAADAPRPVGGAARPAPVHGREGRPHPGEPRAIPAKTLDYAKYDLVRVFNRLLDAVGLRESMVETVLSQAIAMPAARFLPDEAFRSACSSPIASRRAPAPSSKAPTRARSSSSGTAARSGSARSGCDPDAVRVKNWLNWVGLGARGSGLGKSESPDLGISDPRVPSPEPRYRISPMPLLDRVVHALARGALRRRRAAVSDGRDGSAPSSALRSDPRPQRP